MITWLKQILGIAPIETKNETIVLEDTVAETPKPKKKAKKTAKKKATKVDLTTMKKDELLTHAKKVGVKVNASMKKEDIINAINNA